METRRDRKEYATLAARSKFIWVYKLEQIARLELLNPRKTSALCGTICCILTSISHSLSLAHTNLEAYRYAHIRWDENASQV